MEPGLPEISSDRLVVACPVPWTLQRVGSMATVFVTEGPVTSLDSLAMIDTSIYARFFHAMLARGVCLPPSQYEAFFDSAAHGDVEVDWIASAVREAVWGLTERRSRR